MRINWGTTDSSSSAGTGHRLLAKSRELWGAFQVGLKTLLADFWGSRPSYVRSWDPRDSKLVSRCLKARSDPKVTESERHSHAPTEETNQTVDVRCLVTRVVSKAWASFFQVGPRSISNTETNRVVRLEAPPPKTVVVYVEYPKPGQASQF